MATDDLEQHALARAVAVEILVHGPQPRASLARRLGVSAATLTRVTRPLVEAGLLAEGGAIHSPRRTPAARQMAKNGLPLTHTVAWPRSFTGFDDVPQAAPAASARSRNAAGGSSCDVSLQ